MQYQPPGDDTTIDTKRQENNKGYIFQPETEAESVGIGSPQIIGTAKDTDTMDAYRNLQAENPQLQERKFEKIFFYQVDEPVKEDGTRVN